MTNWFRFYLKPEMLSSYNFQQKSKIITFHNIHLIIVDKNIYVSLLENSAFEIIVHFERFTIYWVILSEEFMAEGNCNKWHSIYHIQYCYIVLFISINIMYHLL